MSLLLKCFLVQKLPLADEQASHGANDGNQHGPLEQAEQEDQHQGAQVLAHADRLPWDWHRHDDVDGLLIGVYTVQPPLGWPVGSK